MVIRVIIKVIGDVSVTPPLPKIIFSSRLMYEEILYGFRNKFKFFYSNKITLLYISAWLDHLT